MSTKTKRRVRLNVIDVLIIILAVALIATVIYRIYTGINDKTSPSQSKYVITFECDDEIASIVDYLKSGKAVYLENSGTLLGHMYSPDGKLGSAYVVSVHGENGESVNNDFSYQRAHICGFMKMNSEAVKSSSGGHYSIGEINVTVGSRLKVYTEDTTFTLVVKSIDPK